VHQVLMFFVATRIYLQQKLCLSNIFYILYS
jgi:hypothetical protein